MRLVFWSSGILSNLLLCVLVNALLLRMGVPNPTILSAPVVGNVFSGSLIERAGIIRGDMITSIDGSPVSSWEDVFRVASNSQASTVMITVTRGTEPSKTIGVAVAPEEMVMRRKGISYFFTSGFEPLFASRRITILEAFFQAFRSTLYDIPFSVLGFEVLPLSSPAFFITEQTGPKGGVEYGFLTASYELGKDSVVSFSDFLIMLWALSFVVAVINLLPIPACDGGYIAVIVFEIARGRELSYELKEQIAKWGIRFILTLFGLALLLDLLHGIEILSG